jgi:hypothetical protein
MKKYKKWLALAYKYRFSFSVLFYTPWSMSIVIRRSQANRHVWNSLIVPLLKKEEFLFNQHCGSWELFFQSARLTRRIFPIKPYCP